MTSSPKVSVIIPLYNREKYIEETVQSVLSQTYKNFELIIVDDGSIDQSRKVLEPFLNEIMMLEHPGRVNKGQSAAINLGIKKSSGEYIAILDSDDIFAPHKLEKQVEFLEKNKNIGLVYGNGYVIDESGSKLYKFYSNSHFEDNETSKILINCYFALPTNALFRRTVFDAAGWFDEDLRSGQDHDMAIRISEIAKLAYIDDCLFFYRKHNESISIKNADLRWRNGFIILKKAQLRYKYPTRVVRKRLAVLHFRIGQIGLENNLFGKSIVHLFLAGILDPFRAMRVIFGCESKGGLH